MLEKKVDVLWASGGGKTDPTDTKYANGWIAEIPKAQHFNFAMNKVETNLRAIAVQGGWGWNQNLEYKMGAKIATTNGVRYCVADNTNEDPDADLLGNFWRVAPNYGSVAQPKQNGLSLYDVAPTQATKWDGNQSSLFGGASMIGLNLTAGSTNFSIGNVGGRFVLVDTGAVSAPDGRSLAKGSAGVHEIFHSGNKPGVSDVVNAVEEAPIDGVLYGRKNKAWEPASTVFEGELPPFQARGSKLSWYNTRNGRMYYDYNDGTSSQWIDSSPTMSQSVPVAASQGEVNAGTDGAKFVTPATLENKPRMGLTRAPVAGEVGECIVVTGVNYGNSNWVYPANTAATTPAFTSSEVIPAGVWLVTIDARGRANNYTITQQSELVCQWNHNGVNVYDLPNITVLSNMGTQDRENAGTTINSTELQPLIMVATFHMVSDGTKPFGDIYLTHTGLSFNLVIEGRVTRATPTMVRIA